MDEDLTAFINEDQKENPNCNYSYSNQKRCSSINGESVCEVINRVQRLCPNARPIEIYSKSSTSKDTNEYSKQPKEFGILPDVFDSLLTGDPLAMFEKLLNSNDRFSNFPDVPTFPHNMRPPIPNRTDNNLKPPSIEGRASGPVERI